MHFHNTFVDKRGFTGKNLTGFYMRNETLFLGDNIVYGTPLCNLVSGIRNNGARMNTLDA